MQALLQDKSVPTADEADAEILRRLRVASHVYDAWTASGTCVAQLADRFMDGSLDALSAMTGDGTDYASTAVPPGVADSDASCPGIGVRHASEFSYEEFVVHHMAPNVPVVIKGVSDSWAAQRDWVLPGGGVDVDYLDRSFGESRVMATDTSRQADGCGVRRNMTLSEYLAWWRQRPAHEGGSHSTASMLEPVRSPAEAAGSGDASQTKRDTSSLPGGDGDTRDSSSDGSLQPALLLYLKDWHFASEHPQYQAYTTPQWFVDDWLNDFHDAKSGAARRAAERSTGSHGSQHSIAACCVRPEASDAAVLATGDALSGAATAADVEVNAAPDAREDTGAAPASCIATSDYRFVYLGPKGSWTPLHADVLRSFSWSVNIAGAKRWLLLPPQHTHLLYDRFGRQMAPSFDLNPGSEEQYPNLAAARRYVLEVRQGAGDAIFVPSGWHHTVENLADTLSINHNWLNGWNLHWGLQLLQREHAGAATAIKDCREGCTPAEFEGLVQRNVAANAGLGFAGLADLVVTIARRELRRLAGSSVMQTGASDLAELASVHMSAAGWDRVELEAEAAALTAESLAAGCGQTGSEAGAQLPQPKMQQLHCMFNLRRALSVLEALNAHNRSVLGSAADASRFASGLKQIRRVLDRFDQVTASR